MSKIDDGGPAFPTHAEPVIGGCPVPIGGMSLRDWIAGQALASGLVKDTCPEWRMRDWFGDRVGISPFEIAARAAYAYADAMIEARKVKP